MCSVRVHPEAHFVSRIGWLRAAVPGANDGIVSTASLMVGAAVASAARSDILIDGGNSCYVDDIRRARELTARKMHDVDVGTSGSAIASWRLDLTASTLFQDPALKQFDGRVSDSGEGRWTIKAAIDGAVPVPGLSSALYSRFSARGGAEFADKLLSAMRFKFGGHMEKDASV